MKLGAQRLWAFASGVTCHMCFAAAVVAMIVMMAGGMQSALGHAPPPWRGLADAALVLQFPLLHSWLLTRRGLAVLRRPAPGEIAGAMTTTTYATVASLQTLALFLLWSPSGVVWWRASGPALLLMLGLYGAAWAYLLKAILDAGVALQSGLLGWWAVTRARPPVYPPLPRHGLFRICRQPIYLGFALTTWTTPTWSPDQLALAVGLTAYCALGARLKERRFALRFGEEFAAYRATTPFWSLWPSVGAGSRADPREVLEEPGAAPSGLNKAGDPRAGVRGASSRRALVTKA